MTTASSLVPTFSEKLVLCWTMTNDKKEMRWIDCILPLRPKGGLSSEDFDAMEDSFFIQVES
jgi:hypothetical protein